MLNLSGTWKAKPDNENIGESEGYYEIDFDDSNWTPIKVPGHWQEEGFPDHQGILWYRYRFEISEKMKEFMKIIRLQFKGVFYYCTIWLNEEKLGSHEGYFDVFDFDVSSILDKENVLCVKVECMEEPDRSNKKQITGVFSDWDASDPLFNPGGIWHEVNLIETGNTIIKYIEIKSEIISENTANLMLRFEVFTQLEGEKKFHFSIQPKNFQGTKIQDEFYQTLKKGDNEFIIEMTIEDAHLWWTHEHGFPYLYQLKVGVEEASKLSDEWEQPFGIREFKREIKGRSWEFFLNNKRIYIRGTNYAPCDHRIANVTRDDYEHDVDLLVNGNFNMIRVHAHVDRIELHEVCAERGVLIWQDFALQWGYSLKIKENAKEQIKRMVRKVQNYPSQALYCCHNEPFTGMSPKPILFLIFTLIACYSIAWLVGNYAPPPFNILRDTTFWGLFTLITLALGLIPTSLFIYNRNKDVLDKELVEAVLQVDQSLPIVPNSGIMGVLRMGTDLHTYEGWYMGKDYRDAYCYTRFPLNRMVCFVTEYGAQAFPELENLKQFLDPSDLSPLNWDLLKKKHRCQPLFFARWFNLNKYNSIEELIIATQEYQAELLKFYNELWRINRYRPNGGTIMFLFNDCFPGITWSVVDYWRTPKKAYYSTQLSFEPVYVMADWPKKQYKPNNVYTTQIYVVNDLHERFSDVQIKWQILNNFKEVVSSGDFNTTIEEDSIQTLGTVEYRFPRDAKEIFELVLIMNYDDNTIQNNYSLKLRE